MHYVYSLGAGLLFGGGYALIGVRSPAPPLVALLGLLGMVLGEQAVNVLRHREPPPIQAPAAGETRADVTAANAKKRP